MPLREVATLVTVAEGVAGPIDEARIGDAVQAALRAASGDAASPEWLDSAPQLEVSVLVTGDDEIRVLNRDYRGVDRATDVLSFSFVEDEESVRLMLPSGSVNLGEIVLSYEYCARQAVDLGHSIDMELAWLTIHGSLQLLGYEHEADEDAAQMEALERVALNSLGFDVP